MSATMMNHTRRQMLTGPSTGSSNKRKEIDGFNKPPSVVTTKTLAKPSSHRAAPAKPATKPPSYHNNKLLAGYLAHEFLSKGTLFGETVVEPARTEPLPLSRTKPTEPAKRKLDGAGDGAGDDEKKRSENRRRYVEASDLLRVDGVHLPGIVNPTQLARFLQLG